MPEVAFSRVRCDDEPSIWAIDAKPNPHVYVRDREQCSEDESFTRDFFPMLGAPLDADDFPALQVTIRGEGRLALPTFGAPNDTRARMGYASPYFWDDKLGAYCRPAAFADHVTRCLPDHEALPSGGSLFADAACTERIAAVTSSPCHDEPRCYVDVTSFRLEVLNVYVVEAAFGASDVVYQDAGARCMPLDTLGGAKYVRLSDALPSDTFVKLQEHTHGE
jgi:hypothetical protein